MTPFVLLVSTFLLFIQVIVAAPTDLPPTVESQHIEARGENARKGWKDGNGREKTATVDEVSAPQPVETPGLQVWGSISGFTLGVKPGSIPKPQIVAIQSTGSLGHPTAAAPTPYAAAQPYVPAQPIIQPQPYIPSQPYVASQPTQPAAPHLSATTKHDPVFCRRWPDTISSDGMGVRVFTGDTDVDIICWTNASIEGPQGRVKQNGLWMKTNLGCYINDADVNPRTRQNLQKKLSQCPAQTHLVGTLQSQYKREDCYSCPSLDCPSQNLGIGPFVDLDCSSDGESVNGNNIWYKQVDKNCFYPSGVFVANGFLGTKPQMCSRRAA